MKGQLYHASLPEIVHPGVTAVLLTDDMGFYRISAAGNAYRHCARHMPWRRIDRYR